MSATIDDNELVRKVQQGDQNAFEALLLRYQDYVFTLALRIVRNREDAEEVAQDAFVKAYRHLADFRGEARFSTWLYTIVNHTAISHLRKKKMEVHSLDDEKILAMADSRSSPLRADRIEQKSRQALVNQAMGMLSADDARILTLFYKAEQSLEEVAAILQVEINAAKVRLHRARTRLKEKLETFFPAELKELN